jgi:hypothetical protein
MTMRVLSGDVPMRTPMRRRGTLIARRGEKMYIANVHGASAGNAAAFWEGPSALTLGTDVTLEFDPTIPAWWIVS